MKKFKPFFGVAGLLIFSLSLVEPNKTISEATEELSIAQKQERSRKYLMSLDRPDLSVSDSEINYTVHLHPESQGETAAYSSEEGAEYSFKYIRMLDLVVIDSEEGTYYGYPFINPRGEKDVLLEANGVRSVYSECSEQFGFVSIPITITKPDDTIPREPVVYPLMKIVSELANFDDVEGIAKALIDIPDIIADGPVNYFLYLLKLQMIVADYISNVNASYQPNDVINGQGREIFDDWVFGVSYTKKQGFQARRGNFKNNGCGIIAIYNMLLKSDAHPNLASVIALTQLCNADLVLGAFGVNPINKEIIDEIRVGVKTLYKCVLVPFVETVMVKVAKIIYDNMIKKVIEEPWWVSFMIGAFPAVASLVVETVLATLRTTLAAVDLVLRFVDDYVRNLGDLSTVVRLLIKNKYTQIDCHSLDDFTNNIYDYSQGIITYWNQSNEDGSPNIGEGAHTVYVEKTTAFELSIYNRYSDSTEPSVYSLASLKREEPFGKGSQFIYGYVWKKG